MKKGYDITDFNRTGMLEIQRIDKLGVFKNDEEAVEQAIKDGIKIIPVEELPENFDRRYLGWIDTLENRNAIAEYCKLAKKYYVTFKVEGRYVAKINANSLEEAREKAKNDFSDADFGELSDIDGEDIIVEDEDGNYVWER